MHCRNWPARDAGVTEGRCRSIAPLSYIATRSGFGNSDKLYNIRDTIAFRIAGGSSMKLPRRSVLRLAAGGAAIAAMPRSVRADAYPARPVRLIVGGTPGSAPDVIARLMAQWLSGRLGQSVFVENKNGASDNLATEAVVDAIPDGYTLLLASASNAINATLFANLKFDFIRDIAPIAASLLFRWSLR